MRSTQVRWWLAVFCLLSVSGCGGTGSEGEGAAVTSEAVHPLVGSWMIDFQNGHIEIDTYKSDGMLEGRVFQSADGTFSLIKFATATYSVSGDTVAVVFEDKTTTATFGISGDTLTITVTSEPGNGKVFTYTRYTGELATVTKTLAPIDGDALPAVSFSEVEGGHWWFGNE